MVTTNEPNIYETGVLDSNAEGNFVYTTLDAAINWIRKNSLWPMPMGLSCCANCAQRIKYISNKETKRITVNSPIIFSFEKKLPEKSTGEYGELDVYGTHEFGRTLLCRSDERQSEDHGECQMFAYPAGRLPYQLQRAKFRRSLYQGSNQESPGAGDDEKVAQVCALPGGFNDQGIQIPGPLGALTRG